MAYQAQLGVALTIMHPVRDINEAFVAGQAASVTQAIIGPDRLAASEVATLSDFATGWVKVTITLTKLGIYTLDLTNPGVPTADGRITSYDISVSAGVAASQNLLTSLDRIRKRLQLKNDAGTPITPGDAHVLDDLLNLIISEVSDEYQNVLGRDFAEASYTEYLDGTGRSSLVLGAGPLVSLTSLESVAYEDDDAGGVTETLTTIARHTYVLAGLRTQPRFTGLGRIDFLSGTIFTRGPRRYKSIYAAGFDPIPEGIVGLATTDVVYRLKTRESGHLLTEVLGEGNISYLRPQQMLEAREAGLAPYRLEAA